MTSASGGWLERGGRWVDGHERRSLGLLLAFYAAVVGAQGTLKLVWVDELITYYIAKQPGLAGIWRALQAGADPNPPLMHVLVKASTAVLGGNALGMRLPSMLCVLLAIVAMWWMLRRWVRPVFALAGVLAFMATRGFDYAYDARSYAPMMGFAMASLALWMASRDSDGWKRFAALAGMAVALAAGISSNYYCVLAFFPIAVGEVVGWKFRWGVWLAMAVAALPLLAYLPLIRHNIAEFGPHGWNRPQASMIGMSYLELVEGIFWPVLGLGIYAVWKRRSLPGPLIARNKEAINGAHGIDVAEAAAVGVLLVYPFLGFAIAVGGAGLISPRCVVPVCCGVGLVAGMLAQMVFGRSLRMGMAVVLVLVMWVSVREWVCANLLLQQRQSFFVLRTEVGWSGEGRILVADPSFVLPLYFYSSEEVRRRIQVPIDFDAIHRMEKDDSGEQNLWAGRGGVWPFPVTRLQEVYEMKPGDVLVARPDGWLAKAILPGDFDLHEVDTAGDWRRIGGVFTPMGHEETRIFGSGAR